MWVESRDRINAAMAKVSDGGWESESEIEERENVPCVAYHNSKLVYRQAGSRTKEAPESVIPQNPKLPFHGFKPESGISTYVYHLSLFWNKEQKKS